MCVWVNSGVFACMYITSVCVRACMYMCVWGD